MAQLISFTFTPNPKQETGMQDRTEPDKTGQIPGNLSIEQQNAIDLLIESHNDRQVAEALNGRRQTVYTGAITTQTSSRSYTAAGETGGARGPSASNNLGVTALEVPAQDLVETKQYPCAAKRRIRQSAAVHILKAGGLHKDAPPPTGPQGL
jgi:hypothetical protein